jgi:hypothetical protein
LYSLLFSVVFIEMIFGASILRKACFQASRRSVIAGDIISPLG